MDIAAKVALVNRLADDIHRRLAAAPAAALSGPTACSQWDVGSVAAHLAGGAIRQRDAMLRGLAGHSGPPDGQSTLPTPDEVQQSNAVSNAQLRQEWGETLLDNFRQSYAALNETLHSWPDWTIGCWHRRRGIISAASYVDLRIQELVIHDWDIRSGGAVPASHDPGSGPPPPSDATDPDDGKPAAALDPDGIIALLPASEMWYQLCFRPAAPLTTPAIYRFDIGGGPEGAALRHDLIVAGDTFTLAEPTPQRRPALTIRANANTYLLCLYNRLDWNRAQRARLLRTTQTPDTIAQVSLRNLSRWFGGL